MKYIYIYITVVMNAPDASTSTHIEDDEDEIFLEEDDIVEEIPVDEEGFFLNNFNPSAYIYIF